MVAHALINKNMCELVLIPISVVSIKILSWPSVCFWHLIVFFYYLIWLQVHLKIMTFLYSSHVCYQKVELLFCFGVIYIIKQTVIFKSCFRAFGYVGLESSEKYCFWTLIVALIKKFLAKKKINVLFFRNLWMQKLWFLIWKPSIMQVET